MPWAGLEHTFPVFKGEKTFHALERSATVIGLHLPLHIIIYILQYLQVQVCNVLNSYYSYTS
jgi:hypothetical protein